MRLEGEREINRERERSEWIEDNGGQIGWVWGWSGVEWAGGQWQPDRRR